VKNTGPVSEQPSRAHSTHPPAGPFRCARLGARSAPPVMHPRSKKRMVSKVVARSPSARATRGLGRPSLDARSFRHPVSTIKGTCSANNSEESLP